MLGAECTNQNGKKVAVNNLAIFNLNSKKGYLCYKTIPNGKANLYQSDTHDLDTLGNCCMTKRDLFFAKSILVVLSVLGVITAISSYVGTKSILMALFFAVLVILAGGICATFLMGQSKSIIANRIWEIAKMLKRDLAPSLK